MVKHIAVFLVLVVSLSMSAIAQELPEYSNSSVFKLQIEGLKKAEGEIRIAMFNSKDSYTKDPIHAVVITVDSTLVEWEVDGLPFGEYAIAVYHDKNENGKLDTNFLGIPKESYGFSNNARGRFGPASWDDAQFVVTKEEEIHLIKIK
ncbi:MAG: DUF2141 domain-containing protein [Balneola sp.]|nr:MAG: DUF2141 domain-containing protein [Balneola sp.]